MSDLNQALQQLNAIHRQVARETQFRGYGPASIAASGLLALAVAAVQNHLIRDGRDFYPFLFVWVGTAAIAIGLTASETIGRARRAHSALANDMILLAVEQFLPALVAGVLLTAVFSRGGTAAIMDAAWFMADFVQLRRVCLMPISAAADDGGRNMVFGRRAHLHSGAKRDKNVFAVDDGGSLWRRPAIGCRRFAVWI